MNAVEIKLSEFGRNLGSRNLGEKVFDHCRGEILMSHEVIVDFSGVEKMTLSFGTEFFDSIYSLGKDIKVVNANNFVSKLVDFCLNNKRKKGEMLIH